MKKDTALDLLDGLIRDASIEINSIKSQVVADMIEQIAIYSHDHIGADRKAFGQLSASPSLDREYLDELVKIKTVLLDREQRRNALKHLRSLLKQGDETAERLLREELTRFFSEFESYQFFLEPEAEYPNEHVKPYPYVDEEG